MRCCWRHAAAARTARVGGKKPATSTVFTYDTYTQVMVDGWDPATEYSNGIIAMSNMYETLTRYNPVTHRLIRCSRPAGRTRPTA